jgi:tape measure domain-containing protein
MANEIVFSIKLQDFLSGPMQRIAGLGNRVNASFQQLQQRVEQLQRPSSLLGNNLYQLRNALDELRRRRDLIDVNEINKLRTYNTEIKRLENNIRQLETTRGGRLKTLFSDALNQLPFVGLLRNPLVLAGGTLASMVKWGSQQQVSRMLYETMAGNVQTGQALFKQLQQYAVESPYAQQAVLHAGQMLLNSQVPLQQIMPVLKMIGDIAGGDAQRFESLALAFAQVTAKGKLQGQEYLQLVNAGFNPLAEIAQKTGISMNELTQRMEKGQITVDMVTQAFQAATGPGGKFYQLTEHIKQSFSGQLSNTLDTFRVNMARLGETILPLLTKALQIFNAVLGWLLDHGGLLIPLLSGIAAMMVYVKAQAIGMSLGFGLANTGIQVLAGGVRLISTLLKANVFGLVFSAVVALAVWLWRMYQTNEKVRGSLAGLFNVLKLFGNMLKDMVIGRIAELVQGIGGVGQAFVLLFKGRFSEAFKTAKQAAENLLGVNTARRVAVDVQAIRNGAIQKSYQQGYARGIASLKASKTAQAAATPASQMLAASAVTASPSFASTTASDSPDRISSAGPRNITINLRNLIERLEIKAVTDKQGIERMEDAVKEALLRVLNSANAQMPA